MDILLLAQALRGFHPSSGLARRC